MRFLPALLTALICAVSLSAQTKPLISGVQAHDFAAASMDGSLINTSALRGKIVVLNLWFVNCPNCVAEIKLLNKLVEEYKDNKDVVFLAPAASSQAALQKFLIKNPFSYQVLPNSTILILSKFGTPDKSGEINIPFPMHYVLDRDGKIVAKAQGIKGIDAVRNELKRQFAPKVTALN